MGCGRLAAKKPQLDLRDGHASSIHLDDRRAAAVLAARRTPRRAQTAAQGALLERALDAATAGDWPEAETLARRTGSKVAADLVTWVRLRDGAGNWDEYQRFLELHADWPGLAAMRRVGRAADAVGQAPERGLRLLRRRAAADRHRLAAPRRGARRPAAARPRPRPRSSAPGASSR